MLKLSKTSKLDGILSWSLQARETCPGAVGAAACEGCYATTGAYLWRPAIQARVANKEDWKRPEWVQDMVQALRKQSYFRWFDSGDLYTVDLAQKVLEVMKATPWVKHWLPTRTAKFPKYQPILAAMDALPNVKVRFSSDSVDGTFTPGVHGSTIAAEPILDGSVKVCHAYDHGGKCSGCRACWDKSVPVIQYIAHGHKMAKVIKIRAV